MAGTFGAPYRAPCGGWPASPRRWLPNHSRTANKVARWENITKLRDWNDIDTYVAVYPIEPQSCTGFDSCDINDCIDGTHLTEGTQPCTFTADWFQPCAAGSGQSVSQVGNNCYRAMLEDDGQPKLTTDPCQKVGFKNVQSRKIWQGRRGLSACCTNDPASAECDNDTTQAADSSQARYLTAYSARDHQLLAIGGGYVRAREARTFRVSR